MAQPSDATYLRQRARSSRMSAFDAADVCARSAYAGLATAYEIRSQDAEAVSDTSGRATMLDLIEGRLIAATATRL